MKWIEITLATNPLHEKSLDMLHGIFFSDAPREGPWTPHMSLAYDNPNHDSPLNAAAAQEVVQLFPTLLSQPTRKVTSLRLWSTYGRLDQWYCLDTIHL